MSDGRLSSEPYTYAFFAFGALLLDVLKSLGRSSQLGFLLNQEMASLVS